MGLNPMIYIVVTAVCATISVFTAFLALRESRRDQDTELRTVSEMSAQAVERGYLEVIDANTRTYVIRTAPRIDQLLEAAKAGRQEAVAEPIEQLLSGRGRQSVQVPAGIGTFQNASGIH